MTQAYGFVSCYALKRDGTRCRYPEDEPHDLSDHVCAECDHGTRAHQAVGTGRMSVCGAWDEAETGPCGCEGFKRMKEESA